jgi:uncharacterized protein
MKIWYDACTGKHIRYGTAIARRLRKSGHEVIFTTREHPDTLPLAKILGEKPIVVGKYSPQSLFSRLEESANRVVLFSKMFKGNEPDAAISHQSVELCRTAFGLGMPIILTADTPHATAVNRLTIPFANTVIASCSIPKEFLRQQGARKIVQFKGVDEVAWIKDFKPTKITGLKRPLIVVRQLETKAAYASAETDLTVKVAEQLGHLGNVHFIGRYKKRSSEFRDKLGFLDSASLAAQADLVVTPGGTLAREAALQGVPSVVVSELGNTCVNVYLADLGFPLFIIKPQELVETARQNLGKRVDVESKLASLENPLDTIENELGKVGS